MLGLDADRTCHAMGLAATNASGLIATFGSMAKPLNIGRAGASGLQSALLAALGYTSHADILGAGRFLELYDEAPRHDLLVEGLGRDWAILRNGYKPYPCGFVAHAMIDAVRDLRARVGAARPLARLDLRLSTESMQLMGNADPGNELEAKFSLVYEAAVAWIDGHVTPAAFEPEAVRDPRYRSVMALTRIVSSPEVAQHEAFVEAAFADGAVERLHVAHARGTPARPLTDGDLLEKFVAALTLGGIAGGEQLGTMILSEPRVPIATLMDRLSLAVGETLIVGMPSRAKAWRWLTSNALNSNEPPNRESRIGIVRTDATIFKAQVRATLIPRCRRRASSRARASGKPPAAVS